MSHTAFHDSSVVSRLPLKIESIAIWDREQLLVGTEKGALLVYKFEKTGGAGRGVEYKATLTQSVNGFAKKAVKQLCVVAELGLLISLSDGYVNFHRLPSFQPVMQLTRGKGCEIFAVDLTSPRHLVLCLGIRKRLLIYRSEGLNFKESNDIALPDTPKAMVVFANKVMIGFKKEYVMVNQDTEELTVKFPTGRNGIPVCTRIPGEQLLVGKDLMAIFLGVDGEPSRKRGGGLTWNEPPAFVTFAYPYALGVTNRGVEVRSVYAPNASQSEAQTIALKGCRTIAVGFDDTEGIVYAASPTQVWRLEPVPFHVQIEELKANREYEIAISLCEQLSTFTSDADRMRELNEIRELYAHHLFDKGRYEEAMELFMELDCNPLHVIGLYPNLLPRELNESIRGGAQPISLAGKAAEKALLALIQYLSVVRKKLQAEGNTPSPQEIDATPFASCRNMAVIVDTTLLKAYIKTNDSLVASLLRIENACHTGECEKVLKGYYKWEELVLLYRSKGLHVEALEELTRLAQGSQGSLGGPKMLVSYLRQLDAQHLDLIMKYSRYPLTVAPDIALDIFTTERTEHPLPSREVLGLLKHVAQDLVERYLEWLIEGPRKETLEQFHNELALQYLDTISRLPASSLRTGQRSGAGGGGGGLHPQRRKLVRFLEREPHHYSAAKLLNKLIDSFPTTLQEERAVLYSRLGRHEKALAVYVHELGNYEMAEQYCERNYNEENEAARDVYLHLLKVLVHPPTGQPAWPVAMDLLQRHFQHVNAGKALELLPDDSSIHELYSFFENVLRDSMETRRNDQVIKNLLKAENLQVREKKLAATSAYVIKIEEDTMCPVCNKRMGISAFACYPNGKVVHYKCRNDNNKVCPVTGKRFDQS